MKFEKLKVSSFTEVATGGTPSTSVREYWDNGTIPWLNSGELNKGIITEASNFITEAGLKSSSTRMMPPETVLIALTGATTGLTALLKIDACANQSVTGILPSKRHDSKYLYYYFKTQRSQILKKAWGGAQPHINQKYIKDYIVPLPSIEDQIHIANILSKAEALISQRKESLRLLDELLKSTFLEMFGDPVRNEKGWNTITLESLIDSERGISYGIVQRGEDQEKGIPVVRIRDIEREKFVIDDFVKTKKEISDSYQRTVLKGGEILISIRGTLGRVCIAPAAAKGWNISREVAIIPSNEKIDTVFLLHLLKSKPMQRELEGSRKGVAQSGINLEDLRKYAIIDPQRDLQNRFSNIVEKIEALKAHYQTSLQELENLYGSLSQRAFRGELGLKDGELAMAAEPNISNKEDLT